MSSRKRIRVAVIGVGYLGRFHAQKYASLEGAELVAVYDASAGRAREIAAEVNCPVAGTVEELYGRVDAVSIVTPTAFHHRLGMEFLGRGVHVMMEKPIASSSAEARELVAEAARTNAILQVGHIERFNGAMAALGGRKVEPVFIEADRRSPFPNRSTDVDVIMDVMIHDIDLVLSFAASDPVSVEAVGFPVVSPGKADFAAARVGFANGVTAAITASRVSRERVRRINIFEREAVVSIDYAAQALSISRVEPKGAGVTASLVDEEPRTEKKDALLEEIKAFLECVSEGKRPLVSGVEGLKALELAERIQKACGASCAGN